MRVSTFFTLLSCCGCWRPISWSSTLKTAIYNTYTVVYILLATCLIITSFGSVFSAENIDEFADMMYILITICVGFCKSINVLLYREKIIAMMNVFSEEPCAVSDMEEEEIQLKCDNAVQKNAFRYMLLIESSVGMTIISSILTNYKDRRLTYNAWLPYNYTSAIVFPFTFGCQLLAMSLVAFVQVATDVLFFGVLMQICCQFEILLFRLSGVATDSKSVLRRFIRHHNCIYQLAAMMNETLSLMIFSQFFGSFMVLCLSLVQLLNADVLSTEFLATVFYLTTILMQCFLYCWYGNEVKLKSIDLADAIFHIDWTRLNKDAKQILLISMIRTLSPIELDSVHVITVNIDFFMNVGNITLASIRFSFDAGYTSKGLLFLPDCLNCSYLKVPTRCTTCYKTQKNRSREIEAQSLSCVLVSIAMYYGPI